MIAPYNNLLTPSTTGSITRLVALGDVHRKWAPVQVLLDHEFPHGNGVALSVGDLVTYPRLSNQHRIFFVHGNHENFHEVTKLYAERDTGEQRHIPLFAGDTIRLGGLTVAGIPGVYSEYFFHRTGKIPMKYFTAEHVNLMLSLERSVDILLTHDAPHNCGMVKEGVDIGQPLLTGIIEYLKPRLVLSGHHHRPFRAHIGETLVFGLDYPRRSYHVIEYDRSSEKLRIIEHVAKIEKGRRSKKGYQYDWMGNAPQGQGTLIFEGWIPRGEEQTIAINLKEKHREEVFQRVSEYLSQQSRFNNSDGELSHVMRAHMAVDKALRIAARYAAHHANDPAASNSERHKAMREAREALLQDAPTAAAGELELAFEQFIQKLGLE